MITLKGNDGNNYTLADANYFTNINGGYWNSPETSTIIDVNAMYLRAMNVTTSPTWASSAVCSALVYHTYEYDQALAIAQNEWFWLFGDAEKGGMAWRYYSADMVEWIMLDYNTNSYLSSGPLHRNKRFYLIDHLLYAGNDYGNNGIAENSLDASNNDLGFYVTWYWYDIANLSMTQSHNFTDVLRVVGQATPISAVTEPSYQAEGCCEFSGSDNGMGIEIGGTLIGYYINPFFGFSAQTYPRFWDSLPPYDPTEEDPNGEGGYNDDDGGYGTVRRTDEVDFPELPPSALLNSGIIKMFNPSSAEMNDFVNFIYSSPSSIVDNFKKIWVNPMDSIISLGLVPFAVTQGTAEEVKFCGVSSGVYMHPITSQYITIDCGTLHLSEEYKSLLDYNSYTKVKCFLPFFGFVDLNADDVMDSDIHIKYNVDLLTGESLAIIKCSKVKDRYAINVNSCIYQFKGNVITQAPLTGNNYQQLYSGVLNLVTAVALPSPSSVTGVAQDIMGQKVTVQRGGSITGNGGALGEYTPFLVLEVPVTSIASKDQRHYIGYPHNKVYKLDDLSGYTEIDIDSFRINDIENITDEEADELISILEGGFVL